MIKKAIILAAGKGTRMDSKGKYLPKCLLKVPGTKITFLERQIKFFKQLGLNKITIITGHQTLKIKDKIKSINMNIKVLYFPYYKSTNNLQTLLFFKEELNEGLICLFSDLIYEKIIIKNLLKKKGQIVAAIDTGKILSGTMRIKKNGNKLTDIGPQIKVSDGNGNFIGICKFNEIGIGKLKNKLILNSNNKKDYYTLAIKNIMEKSAVNYLECKKNFWMEIDNSKDYSNLRKKLIKK